MSSPTPPTPEEAERLGLLAPDGRPWYYMKKPPGGDPFEYWKPPKVVRERTDAQIFKAKVRRTMQTKRSLRLMIRVIDVLLTRRLYSYHGFLVRLMIFVFVGFQFRSMFRHIRYCTRVFPVTNVALNACLVCLGVLAVFRSFYFFEDHFPACLESPENATIVYYWPWWYDESSEQWPCYGRPDVPLFWNSTWQREHQELRELVLLTWNDTIQVIRDKLFSFF